MFNSKKIKALEYEIKNLRETVHKLEALLSAVTPAGYIGYPSYMDNAIQSLKKPDVVTLWDLVDEFRRTYTKVNCSSHWEPKLKG